SDLEATHPERIPNRRARPLTTHCLHAAKEELLLDREMPARCPSTQSQRTVERGSQPVRESRLHQSTRVVESPCSAFELDVRQRAEPVWVQSDRRVMSDCETNNISIHRIDVRELARYSTR